MPENGRIRGSIEIRDTLINLNQIYQTFNTEHPADFTGHSVSVSDVIVLQWRGNITSHYVDSYGFKELPAFLGNEKQLESSPIETTVVSGVINTAQQSAPDTAEPTVSEYEARVKAGEQISLLGLSRAIHDERVLKAEGKSTPESKSKKVDRPSILGQLLNAKKSRERSVSLQMSRETKKSEKETTFQL